MKNLFNNKIDIEYQIKTPDNYGGHTIFWVKRYKDMACRIRWLNGNEKIYLDKNTWLRDARVYCGVIDVGVTDRISYADQVYEIVNPENPDENNKFLAIDIHIADSAYLTEPSTGIWVASPTVIPNTKWKYWGLPTVNGSVRLGVDNNAFVIQHRELGTWVEKWGWNV